jgi:hypothetical protein
VAETVAELKVPVYYGTEVTGFAQDDTGVDVALSDGHSLRAEYLVGCDGGRSLIRRGAGIEFPGWEPTTSALLAEVEMSEEPELGIRGTPSGMHALGKVEYEIKDGEAVYTPGGTVGVMLTESQVGTSEPTPRIGLASTKAILAARPHVSDCPRGERCPTTRGIVRCPARPSRSSATTSG